MIENNIVKNFCTGKEAKNFANQFFTFPFNFFSLRVFSDFQVKFLISFKVQKKITGQIDFQCVHFTYLKINLLLTQ